MALILNIETATTVCSVALAKDGKVISSKEVNEGYTHAENLTLFVEEVLKKSGHKISNVDAFAVSKGPGSYTGLRIGVSAAKGFCFALDKPFIAINTLEAMTRGFLSSVSHLTSHISHLFCPMIDARRMEVYYALFDKDLKTVKKTTTEIIDENSFSETLRTNTIAFFGNGAAKCKEKLSHQKNAIFYDAVFPSAKAIAALSEEKFQKKEFEDIAYFEPFYLKDFVAGKSKSI
jgi:tRNA threonylcarbamoyladenosine biosynthesis protein TsaB